MNHLIKDLDSIVLIYVPLFQLYDMEKLYPKEMKYFLGKKNIGEKIRGNQRSSCGGFHTMYITEEGHFYVTGRNDFGQSGLGDNTHRNVYEKVAESVVSVSCGYHHSMYINKEGHLYATGYNENGQLGLGASPYRNTFTRVRENVVLVSCGAFHTMYINEEGHLYATGNNNRGQLGLGDKTQRNVFTKVGENIVSVYCGYSHSMYINKEGQLSGDRLRLRPVAQGNESCRDPQAKLACSLPCTRTCLYATGNNSNGELGLDNTKDIDVFTKIE